jgi:hypothetical protein
MPEAPPAPPAPPPPPVVAADDELAAALPWGSTTPSPKSPRIDVHEATAADAATSPTIRNRAWEERVMVTLACARADRSKAAILG